MGNTPSTIKARWRKRVNKIHSVNVKSLKQPEIQAAYVEAVMRDFRNCDDNESGNIADNIKSSLTKTAAKVIPERPKMKSNEMWRDDGTFNDLINERARCERNTNQYKGLSKTIKKRVRYLRNKELQEEADEIDLRSQKRDLERLYRSFKDENHAFKNVKSRNVCDPIKLKAYFQKHFMP